MISTISFIGEEKNFSLAETPSRGERVDVEGYRTSRGRRTWRRGGAEGIVEGGVDVGRRRGRRAEGIVEGRVAVGGRRARAGNRGGGGDGGGRRRWSVDGVEESTVARVERGGDGWDLGRRVSATRRRRRRRRPWGTSSSSRTAAGPASRVSSPVGVLSMLYGFTL